MSLNVLLVETPRSSYSDGGLVEFLRERLADLQKSESSVQRRIDSLQQQPPAQTGLIAPGLQFPSVSVTSTATTSLTPFAAPSAASTIAASLISPLGDQSQAGVGYPLHPSTADAKPASGQSQPAAAPKRFADTIAQLEQFTQSAAEDTGTTWVAVSSNEDLKRLYQQLNSRGEREGRLKQNLEEYMDMLSEKITSFKGFGEFEKDQSISASASEDVKPPEVKVLDMLEATFRSFLLDLEARLNEKLSCTVKVNDRERWRAALSAGSYDPQDPEFETHLSTGLASGAMSQAAHADRIHAYACALVQLRRAVSEKKLGSPLIVTRGRKKLVHREPQPETPDPNGGLSKSILSTYLKDNRRGGRKKRPIIPPLTSTKLSHSTPNGIDSNNAENDDADGDGTTKTCFVLYLTTCTLYPTYLVTFMHNQQYLR